MAETPHQAPNTAPAAEQPALRPSRVFVANLDALIENADSRYTAHYLNELRGQFEPTHIALSRDAHDKHDKYRLIDIREKSELDNFGYRARSIAIDTAEGLHNRFADEFDAPRYITPDTSNGRFDPASILRDAFASRPNPVYQQLGDRMRELAISRAEFITEELPEVYQKRLDESEAPVKAPDDQSQGQDGSESELIPQSALDEFFEKANRQLAEIAEAIDRKKAIGTTALDGAEVDLPEEAEEATGEKPKDVGQLVYDLASMLRKAAHDPDAVIRESTWFKIKIGPSLAIHKTRMGILSETIQSGFEQLYPVILGAHMRKKLKEANFNRPDPLRIEMQNEYAKLLKSNTDLDSFKALVRKYHPDLNPGDATAEVKYKIVNSLYDDFQRAKTDKEKSDIVDKMLGKTNQA